ncbi:uncharacterized protein LOC110876710 [Helianthus annuus]|uniref:uncharacterized protein LOC110876710 n=1 Tax=Helianthus annuus TaxID=4232 RepID=UPI000B9062EE|nr:uncharacterized protein LOC110876710 [Helianthus annuus]
MTATQSPASIVQNVNMENELGIMQKPPKLMNLDEYVGWLGRFKNWVQANHFECWMKIEKIYVPPVDGMGLEKGIGSLTETEQNDFKAEKKMVSILQQAVKEDILVLLQHDDNSQSMWQALKLKFQGSVSMIKSKKALIKKEFDIFTGMKGETTKQLIERYCHLVVEMKRLEITKTNEEWIDKLSDALPYDEWGTYLMMLKNNSDFVNLNLSSFIEKIEAHELELLKIKKMNSANVQQDVSLYYKGSTPVATNQSPKIQTGFSADTNSSASRNTTQSNKPSPFVNYDPNFKAQEQPSPQSSTSSNNQAYVSGVQCNIAVNIKNGNEITETAVKQHIALLASVLEACEGLVAGRIGRNSLSGPDQKLGFDKSKAIYHRPNQQPAVQRPQIENKPEKALIVNQDDERVAEGFTWDKYIPGSDGQAMMAEIVEVPEMVTEPEMVIEDVSVENVVDIEEIVAEVYYYQSEQEVLASSMKSIMPPKVFESFAGYLEEPTTGSCPRYEEKKEVVEEMIDVTKELTGETLKDIADKALMGKLKEVDTELEKLESVSTVSVKQESDQKYGVQEVKVSESELKNVGKQDVKIVCDEQVLDEESDNSEKSQSEKAVSESEDEEKLYSDFEYPLQNVKIKNVEKVFNSGKKEWEGKGNNKKNNFKNKGIGFEKKTAKQVVKPKEKMNDIFVAGPSVDDEKDYIFSQKAVDDFNTAKKLKEETVKSTFVKYHKRGLPRSILSKWIMDSGASRHMTGTLALLYDVKSINGSYVGFAGNQGDRIVGQGTLTNGVISFEKVNYIVELENNLLSISQICDKSFSIEPRTYKEALTEDSWVNAMQEELLQFEKGSSVIFNPLHNSCCDLDVKKNTELAKFSSILEFMGRIPIQKALTGQCPLYKSHIKRFWKHSKYDEANKAIHSIVKVHNEKKEIVVT